MKERHIPYFATASLRKLINSLGSNHDITRLEAKANSSVVEELRSDERIGFTENERTTNEAVIDFRGGAIHLDRVKTRLDGMEPHDMSIDRVRIKTGTNKKLRDAIKRPWMKRNGTETKVLEQLSLSDLEECYLEFENEKIDFEMDDYNVAEDKSFEEFWRELNECRVCGRPIEVHGFKHTTLNLKDINFPWIRATFKRSQRPDINPYVNVIAKWVFHKVVKPTGLASPNGMFNYRLGKEDQWILKGV